MKAFLIPRVDVAENDDPLSNVFQLLPEFRSTSRSVTIATVQVQGDSGKRRTFDVELSPSGSVSVSAWPETPVVAPFDAEPPSAASPKE